MCMRGKKEKRKRISTILSQPVLWAKIKCIFNFKSHWIHSRLQCNHCPKNAKLFLCLKEGRRKFVSLSIHFFCSCDKVHKREVCFHLYLLGQIVTLQS